MHKRKKTILWTSLGAAALVLITPIWAYSISSSDPLTQTLQKIYPAAFVGSGMISIHDWNENLKVAILVDSTQALDNSQAIAQMIKSKQEEQVAIALRIPLNAQNFTDELNYVKAGHETEYSEVVRDKFFGSESLFHRLVVVPEFLDGQLRIKYNGDLTVNQKELTRAQNILSNLAQGQKFEDLAKAQSDDKATGQFGGDLGFAPIEEFLPELQPAIQNSKLGEVNAQVITSRLGYHIIYPVETADQDGQKLWHVKHIFVATSGYDQWLQYQLDRVSVRRIK